MNDTPPSRDQQDQTPEVRDSPATLALIGVLIVVVIGAIAMAIYSAREAFKPPGMSAFQQQQPSVSDVVPRDILDALPPKDLEAILLQTDPASLGRPIDTDAGEESDGEEGGAEAAKDTDVGAESGSEPEATGEENTFSQ